jgi:hypothetical protein
LEYVRPGEKSRLAAAPLPSVLEIDGKAIRLNSGETDNGLMKVRLPKFLTPKRRYAVDESNGLVKFGRSHGAKLMPYGRKIGTYGRAAGRWLGSQGHKSVLVLQWGRFPQEWELTFVSKMKSLEGQGVKLQEVLKSNLPLVIGESPSDVLLRQIGRKARSQPKAFAKTVSHMFGNSGRKIIVGLNSVDLDTWLEARNKVEDFPWKSAVDAIHEADAKSGSN